jgi:hypothetical protein
VLRTKVLAAVAGLGLALTVAAPAQAETSREQRLAFLLVLTLPTPTSYQTWDAVRLNRDSWSDFGYDWSTDYCSYSPDRPFGFDFRLSCWRHDFGYQNYRALGALAENKAHVDEAFYVDLLVVCRGYGSWRRPLCNSLAFGYYQAVVQFGIP